VTPELAQIASGVDAVEVQSMITEAERLGLLGRRAKRRSAEQRYHPLVREFLEDRLRREVGPAGVNALHVAVATWAEPHDWRTAAHHFSAANRASALRKVLEAHIGTVVASGAFVAAAEYLPQLASSPSFAAEIIRSRIASLDGDTDLAVKHAGRALALAPGSEIAVLNLASSAYLAGDLVTTRTLADRLGSTEGDELRELGVALRLMVDSSLDGDVGEAGVHLEELATRNRDRGQTHFEGVSLLNASLMHKARGNAERALTDAAQAIDALSQGSSGSELASARFAKAWAVAWAGDLAAARSLMRDAGSDLRNVSRTEYLYELADLESTIGDIEVARAALRSLSVDPAPEAYREMVKIPALVIAIRERRLVDLMGLARGIVDSIPTAEPGRRSRVAALRAVVSALLGESDAAVTAAEATTFAERRGASQFAQLASLALAYVEGNLGTMIAAVPERLRPVLTVGAELVVTQLASLPSEAAVIVESEAVQRPQRWRHALRMVVKGSDSEVERIAAARLLDVVGEASDISLLRQLAKKARLSPDRSLGRGLARRLAPRVYISDLGRMRIFIGGIEVPGGTIRRKVLALLCFLLTRPQKTATREEAMDALWPEIDPTAAANSLNQTIYFLRRVFEPDYDEDRSPGYVRQESDLVVLDPELVESASSRCAALISQIDREGSLELVERLSSIYVERFATDFSYDDWAVDFREWLHVSYLQIVETAITTGIESGQLWPTLPLARRALEAEPRLDSLALSLLKLLKGTGAHAAAAEQYERYASLLRSEIGVEAPPFDSL
jgi:DNA-binding SARP family transcriptional activator/tetratricopeptide (TPR) repeat protein